MRWRNDASCAGILSEVAADWLIEHMQPEWAKRYWSRFSDFRLPKEEKARTALAEEIGPDGRDLLENLSTSTTHAWVQEIPARDILRRVWIHQYHASEQEGTPWRTEQELPPAARLLHSPYESEARYRKKKQTEWVGYQVHFTEGGDAEHPHCILKVTTPSATLPACLMETSWKVCMNGSLKISCVPANISLIRAMLMLN